jgi:hypothetical protein
MATGVCLLQRSKVAANSLSHASCSRLAGFRKEALADSMKVRSSCSKLLRPFAAFGCCQVMQNACRPSCNAVSARASRGTASIKEKSSCNGAYKRNAMPNKTCFKWCPSAS